MHQLLFPMNLRATRIVFIIASLWLNVINPMFGQPSFRWPNINNAPSGAVINLNLRVFDFDSVVSAQYVMRWDPQVLQYQSVDNFNLPCLSIDRFNTLQAIDSGWVRFQWECNTITGGVTLADSSIIYRLRLKAIAPINNGSAVEIVSLPPTYLEVNYIKNGSTHNDTSVMVHQGFVAIGYTVDAKEPALNTMKAVLQPNPVTDAAQISFTLESFSTLHILISDVAGRVLSSREMQLSAGEHTFEIDDQTIREKGTYFLTLKSENQSCTLPFIRL